MDTQKYHQMIRKMVHPNVTVSSLAMYAKSIAKQSPDVLCAFLEVSCENDIFKTASVVHLPLGKCSQIAKDFVRNILEQRCQSQDTFTHVELLAVTVYKDHHLLLASSPYFTEQLLAEAFALADVSTSCWLLHMGLKHLPEEACSQVRSAFCTSITSNNSRMDSVLKELVTFVLEYNASDVLSVLLSITGAKRIEALCGDALFNKVDELIRSGQDSVQLWEVYFDFFFSRPHTPEELLVDGLWHMEMYADESIIHDVGAIFYLYVAIHYGVEHPVFEHILGFVPPSTHGRTHALRYREMMDSMWDEPEKFAIFLNKTIICNPFYMDRVQKEGYTLFESARDPFSYGKLIRLFEAQASPSVILTIFFCTDLRQNLPLEDVFYLAQRYEVLPHFLEALKSKPFWGVITRQNAFALVMAPLSYFTTRLHVVDADNQVTNYIDDEQKGQENQYTIIGFENGFIRTELYDNDAPKVVQWEKETSWTNAVAELVDVLSMPNASSGYLKTLTIAKFSLQSFTSENDLNLLTQLITDHPDHLPVFLGTLKACKWNSSFRLDKVNLKKDIFDNLSHYQGLTLKMFETLFASGQSMELVLDLYFYSIYKAILPINKLLGLADQHLLMEKLPNYVIYCRIPMEGSNLCRPINIRSANVCSVDNAEGLSSKKPFAATITDYSLISQFVSRITLKPYRSSEAIIKDRGAMFGYLAKNIFISERRVQIISTFPSTDQYKYREIIFNMNCTVSALNIRRSDGTALKQLLQILGKANPFTFQVDCFVDRIYLTDPYKRKQRRIQAQEMAITMLLNAETIEDIRNIYLHTNIKYYMHLPELAQFVCHRRESLASLIPTMFDGTVFHAIADSEGMLCMPWVTQNTIQVDKQYAGMFLHCHLRLEQDGSIFVDVLRASHSEEFYELWSLCKQTGYSSTPQMDLLLDRSAVYKQLQGYISPRDNNADNANDVLMNFSSIVEMIGSLLDDPHIPYETISKQIRNLIRKYRDVVSQKEMETAIAGVTEKWLKQLPDKLTFKALLPGVYNSFVSQYKLSNFDTVLIEQCRRYTNILFADCFEKKLNKIKLYLDKPAAQYPEAPEPEPTPFEEHRKQFLEMLTANQMSPSDILHQVTEFILLYHKTTSMRMMQAAVAEVTKSILMEHPADYVSELLEICDCFSNCYQQNSLLKIICSQIRNYLDAELADSLVERIMGAPVRKNPPTLSDAEEKGAFSQIVAEILESHMTTDSRKYCVKNISKLIRDYHDVVPHQEMLTAVSSMTELFIKQFANDTRMKAYLYGFHDCFYRYYQSVDLLLVLYEQAFRYLTQDIIDFLNIRLREVTNLPMPTNSPDAQAQQTISTKSTLIYNMLQDPKMTSAFTANQIRVLIRNACHTLPLQEILPSVAELTDALIQRYADEPNLRTLLIGIHECFCAHYHSVDLSLILCLQAYQYQELSTAMVLENLIRNSKMFLQYATPEMRLEYFMDRERIPLWKELYCTT